MQKIRQTNKRQKKEKKRKSTLGIKTTKAKNIEKYRSNETEKERILRLQDKGKRSAASIETETPAQKRIRLDDKRLRTEAPETEKMHQQRLLHEQIRSAASRSMHCKQLVNAAFNYDPKYQHDQR